MHKPDSFKIKVHNEYESRKGQEILFKLECYWLDNNRPTFTDTQNKYLLVCGHAISFISDKDAMQYQNVITINLDELDSLI